MTWLFWPSKRLDCAADTLADLYRQRRKAEAQIQSNACVVEAVERSICINACNCMSGSWFEDGGSEGPLY